MEYMGVNLVTVGIGLVGVFAVLVGLEYVTQRSIESSVDRAMTRMRGAIVGIGTIVVLVAVNLAELVFTAPELLIAILGIGSIIAGISWEVFGATALLTYIVGAAVRGD